MEIWAKISAWFAETHLHEQIKGVDYVGLFTNPWFIVPFGSMVGYMFFKQKWKDLVIVALLVAVWWISGTPYMDTLLINGEVQIEKILPVIFGGAGVVGLIIYLLFGKSD